jgi:18S rRNA (adenine1779-N6/adenine1780-N6)-dimethyltransferase
MTRSVIKLLDENRKTIQSLNQATTASTTTVMDTTTTTTNRPDEQRTVPEIMEDILEQEQWRNQRASKLDLDDFLQLLVEFNSHGIHFS